MLPGAVDRVTLFTYGLQPDGAGGYIQDGMNVIYDSLPARITVMTAETAREVFGIAGKEYWRVFLEYCPNIIRDGTVYLKLVSSISVIESTKIYRVVAARHQRDGVGTWHHSSLAIERDEEAEATA